MRERFLLTAPFILYAGNIKPHKNVDRLIEAYSILRRRGIEDVKLLIIGDEISKYPNLRRLVHRFQLHQHVRFLGFVPDATLAVLYRLAARLRLPVALRGLRPAAARGDGRRHAGHHVERRRRCRRSSATPRCSIDPMDAGAIADAMARVLGEPRFAPSSSAAAANGCKRFRGSDRSRASGRSTAKSSATPAHA